MTVWDEHIDTGGNQHSQHLMLSAPESRDTMMTETPREFAPLIKGRRGMELGVGSKRSEGAGKGGGKRRVRADEGEVEVQVQVQVQVQVSVKKALALALASACCSAGGLWVSGCSGGWELKDKVNLVAGGLWWVGGVCAVSE
ncbi:hypothetical protein INS49_008353 [Diaporthe citri]|uniref:uncharacterized protein n=1 Tax=Diaporthe citri TaxID=83186 RepID=UPI001C819157|nr:uncharacterized protein INS49_008353 [Diaporthe citri]KAG6363257.1 hypothetical protein INS49_008353 [Diaporthe citri]